MGFSRIALIYNPESGRPRARQGAVDRFASLLRSAGRQVEIVPTEAPRHATELAAEAVARGCDLVVAYGGDGTMNEVLQSLVGAEAVLGFWPGGTANVLAAELHLPSAVEQVVDRVLEGRTMLATVGRANDRYFLLMAGIGLDAYAVAGVDPVMKRRLGKGAFALSTLDFVRHWRLPPVQVEADGELLEGHFVVAGNAHSYGGGFQVTPGAELSDPHLDICIFDSDRPVDYIRYAMAGVFGAHLKMEGVTYRKVRQVVIQCAAGEAVPVQLDGEATGQLPVRLQTIPAGVRLLI